MGVSHQTQQILPSHSIDRPFLRRSALAILATTCPAFQRPVQASTYKSSLKCSCFGDTLFLPLNLGARLLMHTLMTGTWCQITSASQSFASLTASNLGSQLHVTAWSGSGLTRSLQQPTALAARLAYNTPPPNLPDFYRRADGAQPDVTYDYNLYIPQVLHSML